MPGEDTEPTLLWAATPYISTGESSSLAGTIPWYRRRTSQVGLVALLVIALLLALLLLNDETSSPVKSATKPTPKAAPQVAPRPGVQIAGQGVTQVPLSSIPTNIFPLSGIVGIPSRGAGQGGVGTTPFGSWAPPTLSAPAPVPAPVEIPRPSAPGGGL